MPTLVTTLGVELATRLSRTWAGVYDGFAASVSAAAPTTWGVAIDVPLIVLVAVLLLYQADVMLTPGARMSTQVPKLEKLAAASLFWVAPTVMPSATRAGE